MEVAHGLAPSPPVTPRVADISLLATRATSHAWCDKSHAWSHQPRVDGQLSLPRRDIRAMASKRQKRKKSAATRGRNATAWPSSATRGFPWPRVALRPGLVATRGRAWPRVAPQPRVAFLGHAWHYDLVFLATLKATRGRTGHAWRLGLGSGLGLG